MLSGQEGNNNIGKYSTMRRLECRVQHVQYHPLHDIFEVLMSNEKENLHQLCNSQRNRVFQEETEAR